MGRVFHFLDITKGNYPEISHFSHLAKILEQEIVCCEAFLAAIFLGSYTSKTFSRRSDLDGVLIFNENQVERAHHLVRHFHSCAMQLNVPLRMKSVGNCAASLGNHTMQKVYLRHMKRSMDRGGIIKGNVLKFFTPPNKTAIDEFNEYLAHKVEFFTNGWFGFDYLSSEKRHYLLSKVLEFPIHVARKVCEIKNGFFGDDDSKPTVIKCYSSLFSGSLTEVFRKLVNLDREYSAELEKQIVSLDQESYMVMLHRIRGAIPDVLQFAEMNRNLFS